MQEKDADYAVEHICSKIIPQLSIRFGRIFFIRTEGESPSCGDCMIWIPVEGGKSSRQLSCEMLRSLSIPFELPIPSDCKSIWISRQAANIELKREYWETSTGWTIKHERWLIALWTSLQNNLPKIDPILAYDYVERSQERAEAVWSDSPFMRDFDDQRDSDNSILVNVAHFLVRKKKQLYYLPLGATKGDEPVKLCVIHGIASEYQASQLLLELGKEFPALFTFAVLQIDKPDIENGWRGKYAIAVSDSILIPQVFQEG